MNVNDEYFLKIAIDLAKENVENKTGGPFGAVIVKDNIIIAKGKNSVTQSNDPTAHAEVSAIRNACKELNTFQLEGCTIYSSCEPCPMCLGAIYWARPKRLVFAATKEIASKYNFDDSFIYNEINLELNQRSIETLQLKVSTMENPFIEWKNTVEKTEY